MAQLREGIQIALDEFFLLKTDTSRSAAPAVSCVQEVGFGKGATDLVQTVCILNIPAGFCLRPYYRQVDSSVAVE